MITSEHITFDQQHIWHPYTSMAEPLKAYPVVSAEGVTLELQDGTHLIDGMASWWSVIHGYNHPRLNAALKEQVDQVAHVMFGGLTHEPAIKLAKALVNLTEQHFPHVFFADSGSVSVEVAIKMAIQYWFAQGRTQKQKLLTVRNGYHGDTFGAMAVCDPENGMHGMFSAVLPQHYFVSAPQCNDGVGDISEINAVLQEHHESIAAVIIEPLVQGAGGMRIYCPDYLRQLRALCDQYGVLLIFDEIATGFGRTGSLFAYQQTGIVPDIITLGKALTGGYMTLAATMANTKVAKGISADGSGVLMHGPTFMANPLACRVALESLQLLQEEDWCQQVSTIETQLKQELIECQNLSIVDNVRVKGAIGVVELKRPVDMKWMQPEFVRQGVWVRPFGKLVYIMPPYVITADELTKVTRAMYDVIAAFEQRLP